jgi:predicted ArsR family transcriptional regulator
MTWIDYLGLQQLVYRMGGSDSPGPAPTDTDEDILNLFRQTTDPVLTTTEVADQLSIGRRATLNRLQALENEGRLQSKKAGAKSTVWWAASDSDSSSAGA